MGLETSTQIEEVRDADGNVARPASDETLRQVRDNVGGGYSVTQKVFIRLAATQSVDIPSGVYWDVTVHQSANNDSVLLKLNGSFFNRLTAHGTDGISQSLDTVIHGGNTLSMYDTGNPDPVVITGFEVQYD